MTLDLIAVSILIVSLMYSLAQTVDQRPTAGEMMLYIAIGTAFNAFYIWRILV